MIPARARVASLLVSAGLLSALLGGAVSAGATPATVGTAAMHAARPVTAVAALASLPVKGRAPMTGYERTDDFGAAWLDVDRNGCDTRNDILRRDLDDRTGTRCRVTSGVLDDPYTGHRIRFLRGERTSTAVQIDHVVALGNAWASGAQQWTQAKRVALANDPINLYAVDGPTNAQKSDANAASWLPPRKAFRCTYVAHQIGVKKAYGLWVTSSEKAAMQRVLAACPSVVIPVSRTVDVVYTGSGAGSGPVSQPSATPTADVSTEPATTPEPTATPAPAASTEPEPAASTDPQPGDQGVVTPGAFCSPAGSTGRTAKGTAMVCRTSDTDSRARWRSAA